MIDASKRLYMGGTHWLQGARLILSQWKIGKWAVIPFVIDFLLVVAGVSFGIASISGWITSGLAAIGLTAAGFWVSILYYILSAILWVVYLVLVIYGTFLLATVIAAPFNSLLAERTLMYLGVIQEKPFEFKKWMSTFFKMIFIGLIKSMIFAFIGIFIFVGSFIPVLNVVSSFLALLVMSFDSMDYSFEALELNLKQRFRYFQKNFPEFTGMAGSLAATLFIPGLTLLTLPCSVVGAAIVINSQKNKEVVLGSRSNSQID